MKILVIGGGGREHALVWALTRHGHDVVCAPGNPGIARIAELVPVSPDDIDAQVNLATERSVDLVVVGPEAPLVAGIADRFAQKNIPCLGPSQAAARLEGSKIFSKEFFSRHNIPTAEFRVCDSMDDVTVAVTELGGDVVVKADGLAAGKGVIVCSSTDQAIAAARTMIEDKKFGAAGSRVLIERKLLGKEASVIALVDGERIAVLPAAEDHKQVGEGDRGPNTGGMGVVSPTAVVTDEVLARIQSEVLAPTVAGLRDEGSPYRGVLYAGIMVAPDGTPNVLEFNCRFGDPETEPILTRWQDDPAPWFLGAANGRLPDGQPNVSDKTAVCVIMASEGYPTTSGPAQVISGLEDAEALEGVVVFQAGTKLHDGTLLTAGGRVLAVTALGDNFSSARARVYEAVKKISWPGVHYRGDIGMRHERK